MLNAIVDKWKEIQKKKVVKVSVAIAVAVAVAAPTTVFAWFSMQRKIGGVEQIHSPHVLTITAAQEQAIEYLDLSSINLKVKANDGKRAKYYVFCVCGSDTAFYNLQLAYTTNNQFEYHIYPAEAFTPGVNDTSWLYEYQERNENGQLTDDYYYYKKSTVDTQELTGTNTVRCYPLISGGFLNNQSGSSILANNTKHDATYEIQSGETASFTVQKNAEPLYWQAKGIRSGLKPNAGVNEKAFADYYILEVNWQARYDAQNYGSVDPQELNNDRETDIIYITAIATSRNFDKNYENSLSTR